MITFTVENRILSVTPENIAGEVNVFTTDSPEISLQTITKEITFDVMAGGTIINNIVGGATLELPFTFEDWSLGSKKIGKALGGLRVEKTSTEVTELFNGGTIVIGDADAHGRLAAAADIKLNQVKRFHTEPDHKYETDTDIYVYFETGTPTQGEGTVIIYLR